MRNLKSLHIADIQLSSKQFSSIISKLAQLKTLSFSWTWTSKEEADEVSASSLSQGLSQLSTLNIYISTSDISPLDKITWMLQHCTELEHLAIFTEFLHKDVSHSLARFNITVDIKEMKFPNLKSLILDMKNHSYPGLLERAFVSKLYEAFDGAKVTKFWCSSKWKREFLETFGNKLELLTICDIRKPLPTSINNARHVSQSFGCEQEISHVLCNPCPSLEKLSLHHLMPCSPQQSEDESHSCHAALTKIFKENKDILEGLKELSYTTNGFNAKLNPHRQVQSLETGKLLSSLKFQNLTKLSLPICGFLESLDQSPSDSTNGMTKKRVSHGIKKQNFSSRAFHDFAASVPDLEHLEILSCYDLICCKAGAEGLLEVVPKFFNLKTLVLAKIAVNFSSKPLFLEIFTGCPSLEHLHINSLVCDTQKLCRDLALGLEKASSLKTLKIFQSQWTQFSKSLLDSVIAGCHQLEQIVLIDSSKAFTIKKFPLEELLEISKKEKLGFLYITSELFTTENIKKLKAGVRKISAKKPFLTSRFVKEFLRDKSAFYQLEDLASLPMVYHRAVVSINSLSSMYCSNSTVASVTIEDVF